MSIPTSRAEFAKYCLTELGAPVIEINVSDEQVDDRIDYALQTFYDYHFDGSEKIYYKYIIKDSNRPTVLSEVEIANSGMGYDNTDIIVITPNSGTAPNGKDAVVTLTTDEDGAIVSTLISNNGSSYYDPPLLSITAANGASSNGTGGKLVAFNGGYIPLPDNIIGAVALFDIGDALQTENMFNIRYQISLNDLYTLTSVSMVPYVLAMMHIQSLEQLLVGRQPIRYNRHQNKMYLDMDWERFSSNRLLIAECYGVVDPDVYKKSWNDRWLKQYATALIKKQWGNNMKKYEGMPLPGGIKMNGQEIYNEAVAEIKELEHRMIIDYGYPVVDMIG